MPTPEWIAKGNVPISFQDFRLEVWAAPRALSSEGRLGIEASSDSGMSAPHFELISCAWDS